MRLKSTRSAESATPEEAVLIGLASDGGLFVPEEFPHISRQMIKNYSRMTFEEIAAGILARFFQCEQTELICMCKQAYSRFTDRQIVPLRYMGGGLYGMQLYHGPTLAFKDVALQMLPLLMAHSARVVGQKEKSLLLVATSGDTGKAALEGFADKPDTAIVVFYPKEGVSHMQYLQMATQKGDNVHVIAVEGDFDDCQTGVKQMMESPAFNSGIAEKGYKLSSGNSINFGRLCPQIVYYFSSYARLLRIQAIQLGEPLDFIVPTGNFGNILAGYYAREMGLPIGRLVCASNANNVLTHFLQSGVYDGSGKLKRTTSPSMDILVSSNLERLLYEVSDRDEATVAGWMEQLKQRRHYDVGPKVKDAIGDFMYGDWATDDEADDAICEAYAKRDCLLDPHSAIGLSVFRKYQEEEPGHSEKAVLACTASPYKFGEDVLKALKVKVMPGDKDRLPDILETYSEVPQPEAIAELSEQPIIHSRSCTPAGMEQSVLEWLEGK